MIELRLTGLPRADILGRIKNLYPDAHKIEQRARSIVGERSKREVWLEQAAAIAYLANQYNREGATILEIGACRGYSAAMMKLAAPKARLTTLEPHGGRRSRVRATVGEQLGITVRAEESTVFLGYCIEERRRYDLIFVDGDHNNVRDDLPYWNLLNPGGLFLHHDYAPEGSKRECRPVYEALNDFAARLNHEPEVLVVDDGGVGLWGMYRTGLQETWPPSEPTGQDAIDALQEEAGVR